MNLERKLRAAQGYSELGMWSDAVEELDTVPVEFQERADVLQVRLYVLMQARAWEKAMVAAQRLCKADPKSTLGFIHAAFCMHELGKTREALDFLTSGPEALLQDATYHYNLACYHAVLGDTQQAANSLMVCFKMDPHFRDYAKSDPDLRALRGMAL